MFGHTAVAIVTALYLVFMAAVVARWARDRHVERALRWPRHMNQRQMERYGVRFMARSGWRVSLASSHGSYSLYACIKHEDFLCPLFMRDSSMLSRQLRSLRSENSDILRRVVIVLFEPPNHAMRRAAQDGQVSIIHYTQLPMIEDLHEELLPRVMAARSRSVQGARVGTDEPVGA